MFIELDNYITDFKCKPEFAIDDFWSDVGIVEVHKILEKFEMEDWQTLYDTINNKPIYWQKKIAYCLNNSWNSLELDILLKLIYTSDDELLEITIDSLREFICELNNNRLNEKLIVVEKVKSLLYKQDLTGEKWWKTYR